VYKDLSVEEDQSEDKEKDGWTSLKTNTVIVRITEDRHRWHNVCWLLYLLKDGTRRQRQQFQICMLVKSVLSLDDENSCVDWIARSWEWGDYYYYYYYYY